MNKLLMIEEVALKALEVAMTVVLAGSGVVFNTIGGEPVTRLGRTVVVLPAGNGAIVLTMAVPALDEIDVVLPAGKGAVELIIPVPLGKIVVMLPIGNGATGLTIPVPLGKMVVVLPTGNGATGPAVGSADEVLKAGMGLMVIVSMGDAVTNIDDVVDEFPFGNDGLSVVDAVEIGSGSGVAEGSSMSLLDDDKDNELLSLEDAEEHDELLSLEDGEEEMEKKRWSDSRSPRTQKTSWWKSLSWS
jgi:hypothetical protein